MTRKRNESHTLHKYSTIAVSRLFKELGMNHNMSRIGCFYIYRNLLSKFKEEANHNQFLSMERYRYTGIAVAIKTHSLRTLVTFHTTMVNLWQDCHILVTVVNFVLKVFPMMNYSINLVIKNCHLLSMNETPLRWYYS